MNLDSLREWVGFAGEIIVFVFTVGVLYNRNTAKINGLGTRVKKMEEGCAKETGRVDRMERELDMAKQDSGSVHERLGRVEKGIDSVNEHMNELKVDLGGHLGEIKNMITQKDSDLKQMIVRLDGDRRERIARLEAKANIPHRDRAHDDLT